MVQSVSVSTVVSAAADFIEFAGVFWSAGIQFETQDREQVIPVQRTPGLLKLCSVPISDSIPFHLRRGKKGVGSWVPFGLSLLYMAGSCKL